MEFYELPYVFFIGSGFIFPVEDHLLHAEKIKKFLCKVYPKQKRFINKDSVYIYSYDFHRVNEIGTGSLYGMYGSLQFCMFNEESLRPIPRDYELPCIFLDHTTIIKRMKPVLKYFPPKMILQEGGKFGHIELKRNCA